MDAAGGYRIYVENEALGRTAGSARWERSATVVLLLGLTLVGGVLRLWNLGELPFIVDEGFHALGVRGLLEHGVPKLDHGQLYFRAPLFTYLQAASAAVFGLSEFSLRLPAAILGTLTIPLAYLLARDLVDRQTGWVVAALVALSLWEIELSRYARFYSLFQLLFLLGVWSFYWGFLRDRVWARVLFVASALVAMSIHDLAVTLGTLFLLVLPMRAFTPRRKLIYAALPVAALIAWRYVRKGIKEVGELFEAPSPTRPVGGVSLDETLAARVSRSLGQPVKLPDLEFVRHAWEFHPWFYLMICLGMGLAIGGIVRAVLKMRRRPPVDPQMAATWDATERMGSLFHGAGPGGGNPVMALTGLLLSFRRPLPPITRAAAAGRIALAGGMVAAAAFHQASLVMLLGLAYLAFFVRGWRTLLERPFLTGVSTSLNLLVAWCFYLMVTDLEGWRGAPWRMFAYPDLEGYFLGWMRQGWPLILLGGSLGTLLLLRRAKDEERRTPQALGAWVVLGGVLLPLVAMGLMDWRHSEARYTFHVFPLVLTSYALLFTATVRRFWPASRRALAIAATLAVLLSLDAAPWNSVLPALRDPQTPRPPISAVINRLPYARFHQDQRTAGRHVAEHAGPDDRVIVVGMPHQAAVYRFYAGRTDAVVGAMNVYTWIIDHPESGHLDPITSGRIITEPQDLRETIERWRAEGRRVWVLMDDLIGAERTWFLSDDMAAALAETVGEPAATGQDGVTKAYDLGTPLAPVER